jgi:hypothetical protein
MQTRYFSLAKPCLFFGFWACEKFSGKGWFVAAWIAVLEGSFVPLENGTGLALGWDDVGFDGFRCGDVVAH